MTIFKFFPKGKLENRHDAARFRDDLAPGEQVAEGSRRERVPPPGLGVLETFRRNRPPPEVAGVAGPQGFNAGLPAVRRARRLLAVDEARVVRGRRLVATAEDGHAVLAHQFGRHCVEAEDVDAPVGPEGEDPVDLADNPRVRVVQVELEGVEGVVHPLDPEAGGAGFRPEKPVHGG
ncbi:MAG: hypothetical protein KA419_04550 [Acidobacteria bacterium]|nr:hypothetical protein [Acidobacteriota bacterium]